MRLISTTVERDIETAFGSASGNCLEPPEIDYRVEDWTLIFGGVADPVEAMDSLGDHKDIYTAYLQATELNDPDVREMEVNSSYRSVEQRLTVKLRLQDQSPCGRRAGLYEKIRL